MVRKGHIDSAAEDSFGGAEVVGEVLATVLELEMAVLSTATVSFVDWASPHIGMLQSSRQAVHWWSGAPITVIAGAHSSIKSRVRVSLSGIERRPTWAGQAQGK